MHLNVATLFCPTPTGSWFCHKVICLRYLRFVMDNSDNRLLQIWLNQFQSVLNCVSTTRRNTIQPSCCVLVRAVSVLTHFHLAGVVSVENRSFKQAPLWRSLFKDPLCARLWGYLGKMLPLLHVKYINCSWCLGWIVLFQVFKRKHINMNLRYKRDLDLLEVVLSSWKQQSPNYGKRICAAHCHLFLAWCALACSAGSCMWAMRLWKSYCMG